MAPIIDAFGDAIKEIKKSINLNRSIKNSINSKMSGFHVIQMTPRHKKYHHYEMLIAAFNKNLGFILDVLEWGKADLEPLRSQLRTLLDLYARACFLSGLGELEQVRRIIGEEQELEEDLSQASPLLQVNKDLAKTEGWDLPNIKKLSWSEKRTYTKEWTIGGVSFSERIANHDETVKPSLKKADLKTLWKWTSNQLHGEVFRNTELKIVDPKYQLLTLAFFLNMHFLYKMNALAELESTSPRDFWNKLEGSDIMQNLIGVWKLHSSTYPEELS